MDIEKKEKLFLEKALRFWKSKGLIDDQQSEKMLASLRVISFDKQGLIRMLFWISTLSMFGALASFLTIKPIMQWIDSLPRSVHFAIFALLTCACFFAAFRMSTRYPKQSGASQALYFLASILTLPSVVFFVAMLFGDENLSKHTLMLQALPMSIYIAVGLFTQSAWVWSFAIYTTCLFLTSNHFRQFAPETNVTSFILRHLEMIFRVLDQTLACTLFGVALIGLSSLFQHGFSTQPGMQRLNRFVQKAAPLSKITLIMGLTYFFVPLFMRSTQVSAYLHRDSADMIAFWIFSLTASSIVCIWQGLRYENRITKGFGITFFIINLYIRFFEFFWNSVPTTIFFSLLALITWILASQLQKWLTIKKPANNTLSPHANPNRSNKS